MDMIEKVRAALLAELRKGETNCVADYREEGGGDEIFIDGHIDGRALARAAIEAIQDAPDEVLFMVGGAQNWTAIVGALLKSHEAG